MVQEAGWAPGQSRWMQNISSPPEELEHYPTEFLKMFFGNKGVATEHFKY